MFNLPHDQERNIFLLYHFNDIDIFQHMNKQNKYLIAIIIFGLLLCRDLLAIMVTTTNFALVQGIRENNAEQVSQAILNNGKEIINTRIGAGISPLHIAAALNEPEITLILLNNGATIDARTDGGFTALHWAAGKNAIKTTALLLKHGADIEAKTATGITPLHWAANNNSTNVINLLLISGAKPLPKTIHGKTPLYLAVAKHSNEAAVSIAYQVVTTQMEKEPEILKSITNVARETFPRVTEKLPGIIESPVTNTPNDRYDYTTGRSLLVSLGLGESLKFIWINDLKLWVGTCEISNAQYKKYDPEHNSMFYEDFTLDNPKQPVVYVSWYDAKDYCDWLNKNYKDNIPLNSKFRLPTSKEWQTIAKCGDKRIYPWGNAWPPTCGNLPDLTARKSFTNWEGIRLYDDSYAVTCPVTKSVANKWGICGLAGNVREWCQDWYDKDHTLKIRHGGCWDFDNTTSLKINTQGFDRPEAKYDTIGFRVVIAEK